MEKKVPKYKDLRFNNKKQLEKWLDENRHCTIHLAGQQDMQKLDVHSTGEILNTDYHGGIYIGKFVNLDPTELQKGQPLEIWEDDKGWKPMFGLIIDDVTFA